MALPICARQDLGAGFIGQEIGDLGYLIARKPDIVIFTFGTHPQFSHAQHLRRDARFHGGCYEHAVPIETGKPLLRYLCHDLHAKAHD